MKTKYNFHLLSRVGQSTIVKCPNLVDLLRLRSAGYLWARTHSRKLTIHKTPYHTAKVKRIA